MLETIDVRASLRHAPRGLSGWHYRRSASGVTSHSHPAPPPGVSLCTYSQTPDGQHRVRVEGNLTSLVHGSDKACYSLRLEEAGEARTALLDHAADLLGDVPPAGSWDVHRLDPSMTYVLPDDQETGDVVRGAHEAFRVIANPRQVVSLHNDQTATLRRSKSHSLTVYDKAAEARSKGVYPDVKNLLRVEQRIRPRNATGEWAMKPDLSDLDALAVKSWEDQLTTLSDIGVRMAATQTLMLVRALIRGGATPNAALRLAAVVELERSTGPGVLAALGVAQSTGERWRSDVRRYLKNSGGEDAALDDFNSMLAEMLPAFAAEHEVTVKKRTKP